MRKGKSKKQQKIRQGKKKGKKGDTPASHGVHAGHKALLQQYYKIVHFLTGGAS